MRIAMVITSYHPIVGGAEKQVAQLARIMTAAGHEVHVLTRHHAGLATNETVDGILVRRISASGPKPVAAASFLLGAARAIRKIRPDVIHCHSLFTPALAGSLGKRLAAVPLIAKPMCGGEAISISQKRFGRRRIAHLARIVDRFVAVSGEIEAELTGLGIPADKIRRIPNGVDLQRFQPVPDADAKRQLRSRLDLPENETLFLFAGRIAAQKRLPMLLEAWPAVIAAAPDTTLLIAGANRKTAANVSADGTDGDAVPDALLHQPKVRLLGHVDDMPSCLRAADAFVLPSSREGLSNALLEACASGLAAVAAGIGGTEDFVESGRNGFLFAVEDPAALTEAMISLARSPDLRERVGAAARKTVEDQYDISDTASKLTALYSELCGKAL